MRFPITAGLFAWIHQHGGFHKLYLRRDVVVAMIGEFVDADVFAADLWNLFNDQRVEAVDPDEMDTGWLILPARPRRQAKAKR